MHRSFTRKIKAARARLLMLQLLPVRAGHAHVHVYVHMYMHMQSQCFSVLRAALASDCSRAHDRAQDQVKENEAED